VNLLDLYGVGISTSENCKAAAVVLLSIYYLYIKISSWFYHTNVKYENSACAKAWFDFRDAHVSMHVPGYGCLLYH
jgi:hypothetical protein